MRIYLDNSVYAFIDDRGERAAVRRLFNGRGVVAHASVTNVLEASAIPDATVRARRARTLTTLADEFENPPSDYLEAQELLNEIRRCRPAWLRPHVATQRTKRLLRARAKQWEEIRTGADPQVMRTAYAQVVDPVTLVAVGRERTVRRRKVEGGTTSVSVTLDDPELQAYVDALPLLERYNRLMAMELWHGALNGAVELCDLRDWLGPHLRPVHVPGQDFERFWLRDVDLSQLPRTVLASTVSYFQSDYRPTRGVIEDMNHALHVLSCDLFLTCDVGLHGALGKALQAAGLRGGLPRLLTRSASSAAMEIARALESVGVDAPGQPQTTHCT